MIADTKVCPMCAEASKAAALQIFNDNALSPAVQSDLIIRGSESGWAR
jgi:hypothetical protein